MFSLELALTPLLLLNARSDRISLVIGNGLGDLVGLIIGGGDGDGVGIAIGGGNGDGVGIAIGGGGDGDGVGTFKALMLLSVAFLFSSYADILRLQFEIEAQFLHICKIKRAV